MAYTNVFGEVTCATLWFVVFGRTILTNGLVHRVFKHAERLNAKRLVLLGTTEWEQGKVSVKDLSAREQSNLTVDELIEKSQ